MVQNKAKKHPSKQSVKVAVDNVIFTIISGELHILLIQMKKKPYTNLWALPGGLIRTGEDIDKAAVRILKEETGVSDVYLEQLYTFGKASRDPFGRVISVSYFALMPNSEMKLRTLKRYFDVKWCKFKDLPKLAYDHDEIAKYAKQRLEWKIEYTNVVWSLLPSHFSLTELQEVYEAILGDQLDKRNFRKKILALNLIESIGTKAMRGAHRPAALYRFKTKKQRIVEIL